MREDQPPAGGAPGADGTGDPDVDAVLTQLEELDPQASLAAHVSVLTEVHEALQRRLSTADG